jgi:PAS domain S-box-containing protein
MKKICQALFLLIPFVIALSLIIFSVFMLHYFIEKIGERKTALLRMQSILMLSADLKNAESSQRGYIITAKEANLEPYRKSVNHIVDLVQQLRRESIGRPYNPTEERLKFLIQQKLHELEYRIDILNTQGFEAAQEISTGQELSSEINQALDQVLAQREKELRAIEESLNQIQNQLTWFILGGNLLLVLVSLGWYWLGRSNRLKFHQAEESNRHLFAEKQALLDYAAQPIIITNAEGIVREFNREAQTLLGYEGDEVVRKSSLIQFYEKEFFQNKINELVWQKGLAPRSDFEALLAASFNQDKGSDWVLKSKDNKNIGCKQTIVRLKIDKEERGFIFLFINMEEKKRWQEELRKTKEQADKIHFSKNRLLTEISQDLRSQVYSIIEFSHLLLERSVQLGDQELVSIKRIHDNGNYLLNLLNEILDLSKIEAGSLKPHLSSVDLPKLAKEVLESLEGKAAEKQVKLVAEIPKIIEPLEADAEKLKEVLITLVGNGIAATQQGSVTIRIKTDDQTFIPTEIDVIDTGKGIEESQLKHIFDPFPPIEIESESQMGLSIAKALCEFLGYQIYAYSQLGKGSTFSIQFQPIKQEKIESDPKLTFTSSKISPSFHGQTVLVIDGDIASRAALKSGFSELGCHVLVATSGEEGIEMAKEHHVDLIVLDMLLSPLNGYEVVQRLQADVELRNIPFAFISIVAKDIRGKIPGALAFLNKPFSRQDLISLLQKCYMRSRSF